MTTPKDQWTTRSGFTAAAAALTLCCFSSCTLIADLDRFQDNCNAGDTGATRSLQAVVSGFDDGDLDKRVEVRIVDDSNPVAPVLVAKAVIDGLRVNPDDPNDHGFFWQMPRAIPPGPSYRMDFFVDDDNDGVFNNASDRGWSEPICSSGFFQFTKNNRTVDIEEIAPPQLPGNFRYDVQDMSPHVQPLNPQELQLMILENGTDRVVAYYRLNEVESEDFFIFIPEVVQVSGDYTVQFFVDVNRDQAFSLPPDHSWEEVYQAGTAGIDEVFVHNLDFVNLDLFQ